MWHVPQVVGPAHARGETLDLLMSDIPDILRVAVVAARTTATHIGYNSVTVVAYDSTLLSVVSSPDVRVAVAEFLNRDLSKVNEWCEIWGIS